MAKRKAPRTVGAGMRVSVARRSDPRLVGGAGLLVLAVVGALVWALFYRTPSPKPAVPRFPAPDAQATLKAVEQAAPLPRDLVALAARYGQAGTRPWPVPPKPLRVGVQEVLPLTRYIVPPGGKQPELVGTALPFDVLLVTPHAYWFGASGQQVDRKGLAGLAKSFEQHIVPALDRAFAATPDLEVDPDPHVSILLGTSVVGISYTVDQDVQPTAAFPYLRGQKLIALDVRAVTDPLGAVVLSNSYARLLLAHERRMLPDWLAAGLGVLAGELSSAQPEVAHADLVRRASQFLSQPDSSLLGDRVDASGTYLWIRYLYDHFGGQALLNNLLNDRSRTDIALLDAALAHSGTKSPTSDVFVDWALANLINAHGTPAPRYGYRQALPGTLTQAKFGVQLGLFSNSVPEWAAQAVQLPAGSYHLEADAALRLIGAIEHSNPGAVAPSSANPSGTPYYWGGLVDGSDSTMTRRFDLTGVHGKVSLRYQAAFNLGANAAYLAVSLDGSHWTALPTAHSVQAPTSGEYYGPAYSGQQLIWAQEVADLSSYVGKVLQVRFEQVQAHATGWGFVVRDIGIPEAGFVDSPCDGGWTTHGFACVGEAIAQVWALRLVNGNTVQAIGMHRSGEKMVADFVVRTPQTLLAVAETPGLFKRAPYTLRRVGPAPK